VNVFLKSIVTLTMNPAVDQSSITDFVTDGKKLKCRNLRYDPGGGGINVSRAITILGGTSRAVFPAGGCMGDFLEQLLKRENIEHSRILIEESTRINIHILEKSTNKQYRFNTPGSGLQEKEWRNCLEILEELTPPPDFIVASGSLPPGVPNSFYKQVAVLSKRIGANLILDTSGEPLRQTIKEGVFLIKPNLGEFTDLINEHMRDEEHIIKKAKQIIDTNQCKSIVISMGASGTFLITKDSREFIHTPIVPINSRIGAGDCMVAGITLKLAMKEPLKKAVNYGVAAGAAAAMTPGTELCRKKDVERLFETMLPQ
jgi:6-phosphofructokinase 2